MSAASGGHGEKEIEDHIGLQSFRAGRFVKKIVEGKTFLHIFVALFYGGIFLCLLTFDKHKIEAEIATKTDLRELDYRLIIKLGAMIVVAIGVVATLAKLR